MSIPNSERSRAWRERHPDQNKEIKKENRRAHRAQIRAYQNEYRRTHREETRALNKKYRDTHMVERREKRKQVRIDQRKIVFSHYGNVCACCGESHYEFLAIDHIDGRGYEHRKKVGPQRIAAWLIKNGFPEGFRTLCHNCNMSRGLYGFCPHEKDRSNGQSA